MTFNGNSLTIGGGHTNSGACSTIAGGARNKITCNFSSIGGGCLNTASAASSFIGSGISNDIVGGYAYQSGIVSGAGNCIFGYSFSSFIGSGVQNNVYGRNQVIGGGSLNCVNGYGCDFIGGGCCNRISGYGGNVIVGGRKIVVMDIVILVLLGVDVTV